MPPNVLHVASQPWGDGVITPPAASFCKILKVDDRSVVYDAGTGALLDVDPVLADVLPLYGPLDPAQVAATLAARHPAAAVQAAIAEIDAARAREGLFRSDRPPLAETAWSAQDEEAYAHRLQHLVLDVTDACNLRCHYCLHGSSRPDVRPHGGTAMAVETAVAALRFFVARCDQAAEPSVSFYGGEPTLALTVVRAVLDDVHRHPDWPPLTFALDTNAAALDDVVIDLVAAEGLRLQISLDGPATLHDRYRRDAAGRGTHARVEDAVRRLLARDPQAHRRIAFQVTLAPPYDLPAVLDYFASFPPYLAAGIASPPRVRIAVAALAGTPLAAIDDRTALRRQFAAAATTYRDACRDGRHDELSTARRSLGDDPLLRVARRPRGGVFGVGLGGCCRPGQQRLHVAVDGTLRPCERTGTHHVIGHVGRGIDREAVVARRRRFREAVGDRCRDCWAARLCTLCFASLPPGEASLDPAVCIRVRERNAEMINTYHAILDGGSRSWQWLERWTLA
jgi:uncharacterized protein